jgi:hypothetical protein
MPILERIFHIVPAIPPPEASAAATAMAAAMAARRVPLSPLRPQIASPGAYNFSPQVRPAVVCVLCVCVCVVCACKFVCLCVCGGWEPSQPSSIRTPHPNLLLSELRRVAVRAVSVDARRAPVERGSHGGRGDGSHRRPAPPGAAGRLGAVAQGVRGRGGGHDEALQVPLTYPPQ